MMFGLLRTLRPRWALPSIRLPSQPKPLPVSNSKLLSVSTSMLLARSSCMSRSARRSPPLPFPLLPSPPPLALVICLTYSHCTCSRPISPLAPSPIPRASLSKALTDTRCSLRTRRRIRRTDTLFAFVLLIPYLPIVCFACLPRPILVPRSLLLPPLVPTLAACRLVLLLLLLLLLWLSSPCSVAVLPSPSSSTSTSSSPASSSG